LTDEIKAGLKQLLEDFKHEWQKQASGTEDFPVPPRPTSSPATQPSA